MLVRNLKKILLESCVIKESDEEEGFKHSTDPDGNADFEKKASGGRRRFQAERLFRTKASRERIT